MSNDERRRLGTLLFTVLNAMQIVSCIPQIIGVARDKRGASTVSSSTSAIWAADTAVTSAHALIDIWDVWLALVNAVHTLHRLAVIAPTAIKRASAARERGATSLFAVGGADLAVARPLPPQRNGAFPS